MEREDAVLELIDKVLAREEGFPFAGEGGPDLLAQVLPVGEKLPAGLDLFA